MPRCTLLFCAADSNGARVPMIGNRVAQSGFIMREGSHALPIPEAHVYACSYDLTAYQDELLLDVDPAMAPRLAHTPIARRAAFLAGRYCAMKAFAGAGIPWRGLPANADRTPAWPTGVIGSISHSDSAAVAAVSRDSDVIGLGVDVESIIVDSVRDEIGYLVVSGQQEQALLDDCGSDRAAAFTLFFSAKEAFFKAVYAQVGRHFDFHAVAVAGIDKSACTIVLQLLDDLCPSLEKGMSFGARFALTREHVTTGLVIRRA